MAPMAPFYAEHLFQAVREGEDEESVHLAAWPEARATANFIQRILGRGNKNAQLLSAMKAARDIVSQALEEREKAGIKVRQPLATLTIPSEDKLEAAYIAIIADEVNVKKVQPGESIGLDTTITAELKEEGIVRDTLRLIQDARKAAQMKPGEHGAVNIAVPAADRPIVEKHLKELSGQTNTDIAIS